MHESQEDGIDILELLRQKREDERSGVQTIRELPEANVETNFPQLELHLRDLQESRDKPTYRQVAELVVPIAGLAAAAFRNFSTASTTDSGVASGAAESVGWGIGFAVIAVCLAGYALYRFYEARQANKTRLTYRDILDRYRDMAN